MSAYKLRLENRVTGEVRELEFSSRDARIKFDFDVHQYRFSYTDPDVENEFDQLAFD